MPGIIPVVTALVTSGVMLAVAFVEAQGRTDSPVVAGGRARVVRPAKTSYPRVSGGRLLACGLGLFALCLGLAAWHDGAQADRLRAEKALAGNWRGSYTSTRLKDGSAVLSLRTENSPYIGGNWWVEPSGIDQQGVRRLPAQGRIEGTNKAERADHLEMTLTLSLPSANPANCGFEAKLTTKIEEGGGRTGRMLSMRGPWETMNCDVAASGEFVLSKPAPPDLGSI